MATNLLLTGGPLHEFDATSAALADLLAAEGITSTTVDDPHTALALLADPGSEWDLVTVNALWWRMASERHAHLRAEWAFGLRPGELDGLAGHVTRGGGLLACHTAAICFDGDPAWTALIGAAWNWDRSGHPPPAPAPITITPTGRDHPLTAGLADFVVDDEIYGFLDVAADVIPLATSAHGGADHPVLWAREVGRGRVVTDLLGHDAASLADPNHAEVVRRAARWLTADRPARRPHETAP